MKTVNRVCVAFFSPCGNVKNTCIHVGKYIASLLNLDLISFDFTSFETRQTHNNKICFNEDDLLIIGTPVYAGRIPNKIMPYLNENIFGNNNPCISIVSYGNRSYDDALSELSVIMTQNNMKVIAAAAVVSEHSFTNLLAQNRPNETDLKLLDTLSDIVINKLKNNDIKPISQIGNTIISKETVFSNYYTPLMEDGSPAKFLKATSKLNKELCTKCGACANVCPMGSIDNSSFEVTKGICIKCQACIKTCTQKARFFDDVAFLSHVKMLEKNYTENKTTKIFT